MPANLTPEFHDADEQFKRAETTAEKITALEAMLRTIPKHKGTEKMQADIKKRLARLRKDFQKEKSSGAHRRPVHQIDREGAGRVVLCGPPNSGKSCLLSRLTHAEPEVADYPFTTRIPAPGMMPFEDIQIQLIDTPPLAPEVFRPWQMAMIEQAELAALIFDVMDPDLLDQTEYVLEKFAERGLRIGRDEEKIIVLGNKVDLPGGKENFTAWKELFEAEFSPRPFSALSESDLMELKRLLFKKLKIVRVYTKPPGARKEKDPVPYVLKQGSTVHEAAAFIHRDLAESFRYARIWGRDLYDGQMVERDHVLHDGDLIEIHA